MAWRRDTSSPGAVPLAQVDAQLHAARTLWLATSSPQGSPHVAPVWFLWDSVRLTFSTATTSRKGANIARNPAATMHLGDGDDVIIAQGFVEPVATSDLAHLVDTYGRKYPHPRSGQPAPFLPDPSSAAYSLQPETLTAWVYGNVSTRTRWQWLP